MSGKGAGDRPRVLLVGMGAVGQVFGHFLRRAGCELSVLVKPAHVEQARRGFTLYALGRRTSPPLLLSGFDIHASARELGSRRWDQVWVCVSSTALRAGDWVEPLARHTGEATWVMLQPALDDRDWMLRHVPAERLVSGMIPFIAFPSPLRPEDPAPPPGTAFWFPPLARGLFSGPPERVDAVVRTLRAGGYPARRVPDAPRAAALPTAVLTVVVAGLEAAGWSFERFLRPDSLALVRGAAREAVRIVAGHLGTSAPLVRPLLQPALFRALVPVASRVVPFDLETYLRVHFTKVGDQGRAMLGQYLDLGRRAAQPVDQLRRLQESLPA